MDAGDAAIFYYSHIAKKTVPTEPNQTYLILRNQDRIVHVYTAFENQSLKFFVLRQEIYNTHKSEGYRSYYSREELVLEELLKDNLKVSILNSSMKAVVKMKDYGLLNVHNTIDPKQDSQLKKVGKEHHGFYFYTHDMTPNAQYAAAR